MNKRILFALSLSLLSGTAFAQSSPGLSYGYVPTAGEWNSYFAAKQDYLGSPPLLLTGGQLSGKLVTAPPTANASGFNLTPGVTPTSPNNGDLWSTSAGVFAQVNGTTVGPLGVAGAGAVNSVFGRTGNVTAQSGDYSAAQISGLGTFATQNFATPPAIGGTIPASGSFSSLINTGIVGSTQCIQSNTSGLFSGTGSVCFSGPASSTQFNIAVFADTTGKIVSDNGIFGISSAGLGGSSTGNAQALFQPTLGSTCTGIGCGLDDGMFVIPALGISTWTGQFLAAYNMKWGDTGSPVPSSFKGSVDGYECNITTAQNTADVPEGPHCFGGTINGSGTVDLRGTAITILAAGSQPIHGSIINVQGTGSALFAYLADSTGSPSPGTIAYNVTGSWISGFQYGDLNLFKNGSTYVIASDGYQSRSGISGSFGNNFFNTFWNGSAARLFVDAVDLGSISVSSDARIKENVMAIDGNNALELIARLKPISFNWRDGYGEVDRAQFGFTAQDMRNVIPNLVVNTGMETEATPDGMLRIDYSGGNIIALLVAALQQQQRDIAALSKR